MEHIRHGDVLLTKVEELPQGQVIKHSGQHVLAWGEVTGHAHRLTVKDRKDLKVVVKDGITYMSLTVSAPLTHEEHKRLEVPSGVWKMTFEREYDPFMESMRQVID